jgi:hypothetical protein
VLDFGTSTFGVVASPYFSPYVYKRGLLDTTYDIRHVGDTFMIGESPVDVDENSNVHIKKQEFRRTKGFWEILTRKRVDKKQITTDDLQQYKRILELINSHLKGTTATPTLMSQWAKRLRTLSQSFFPMPGRDLQNLRYVSRGCAIETR